MQKLMAFARGNSDYVHPDEEVQIVDEATGRTYGLFLKSGATRPSESASVFVHIPSRMIAEIGAYDDYLIIELRHPNDDKEATTRLIKLHAQLAVE